MEVLVLLSVGIAAITSILLLGNYFLKYCIHYLTQRAADVKVPVDPYKWNVEDVCKWLSTLAPAYVNCTTNIRAHGVDGNMLLTEINESALIDLGFTAGTERNRILNELSKLKTANSLVATELNRPFYKTFKGDFCPPRDLKLLNSNMYENVFSCDLSVNQHSELSKLLSNVHTWLGVLSAEHLIDKIEFVFNPSRYRLFLSQLELNEYRATQSLFQSNLSDENNIEERIKVLNHLTQLSKQVWHNRNVKIVRMWHGCSPEALPHILSDGFVTTSLRDDGWLGRGMYFTSYAKYATQYSGKYGCLVMSYIHVLNPFPIISCDAPVNMDPPQFRFTGQGNYKTYQCHYASVSPISYEARFLDNRPPTTGYDDSVFDELVVFQQADILPQIVVHLKKEHTY